MKNGKAIFSCWTLEKINTGISCLFLCVERIIGWGRIGVCPEIYDVSFWVCSCPEGEESRGGCVICKDKIRTKKDLMQHTEMYRTRS